SHNALKLLHPGFELFHLLVAAVFHFYNSKSFFVKGREFINPGINCGISNSVKLLQLEHAKLLTFKICNNPFFKFNGVFTLLANTSYISFHSYPLYKWSTYVR